MRRIHHVTRVICATALLVGCASTEPRPDLRLDVAHGDLELTVSADAVRSLLEGALDEPLECSGDLDPDLRRFLERLDRDPRARATLAGNDGTLSGRRRGGRLDLTADGGDGGRLEATVPWAFGACLLGRGTTVDAALGSGRVPVEVRVITVDGRTLVARLD